MTPGHHIAPSSPGVPGPIRYLKRKEIDTARWDRCVALAPNGWLYARSFFLDGVGRWDALVAGDYDYIMPLPKRRKYGLAYTYIPVFTGQLGIIGIRPVSPELTEQFIYAVPASFRIADLLMNELNPSYSPAGIPSPSPAGIPGFSPAGILVTRRTNYILSLRDEYAILCERYSADAKKNLRRTSALHLSPCTDIPMDTIIRLYRSAYGDKHPQVSAKAYDRMAEVGRRCISEGMGFTLGINDPGGALLAAAFFGMDDKRIYYILGAPTPQGRQSNAVHSLIDEVIRKYAGTGLVFDFEGSDIPSVAAFYRKFSPQVAYYDHVILNRLPQWIQRLPSFFRR